MQAILAAAYRPRSQTQTELVALQHSASAPGVQPKSASPQLMRLCQRDGTGRVALLLLVLPES
jgi:hypothetical protein